MAAVAPSGFWSKRILLLRRFSSFSSDLAPERLLFRISVGQIYTPTSFSFYLFLDPSPSQLEKKELSSSSVSSLTGLPFLSLRASSGATRRRHQPPPSRRGVRAGPAPPAHRRRAGGARRRPGPPQHRPRLLPSPAWLHPPVLPLLASPYLLLCSMKP